MKKYQQTQLQSGGMEKSLAKQAYLVVPHKAVQAPSTTTWGGDY